MNLTFVRQFVIILIIGVFMKNFVFNNGIAMPIIGYGTFKIEDKQAYQCVLNALEVGYRRIDTAAFYANEKGIGKALANSGMTRGQIFVTSKLWTDANTAQRVNAAVDKMLDSLKTDYLDLLLIHWPTPANLIVWQAMEKLVKAGKVLSIGVSNFKEHHLAELLLYCNIPPVLNQIELHPLFQQKELRQFCTDHNIIAEAWSPLMRGDALALRELQAIGNKYNKSAAQVILRYLIENNIAIIPKTLSKARMQENIDIFDFSLSDKDKLAIAALDSKQRQYRDPDSHGF